MSASHHRQAGPVAADIRVAVITVSDTRTLQTDESGSLVEALTTKAGFHVTRRDLVRDEPTEISGRVRTLVAGREVDAILLTGGTGVAARDGTVEALAPLLERRLEGFGELFRMLSFAEVGAAAMLSRAVGGTIGPVAIFAMPGSPPAVQLALSRLILPELRHLVGQLKPRGGASPGETRERHGHGGAG
ncbi:MAG TPA: MogA/MoaB family molybdenum cofactor biosynthesis protein [Polyangia bacterium]